MKRLLIAAALLLLSTTFAHATELPLDWSSADALQSSSLKLSMENQDMLMRAMTVTMVRKFTKAQTIDAGMAEMATSMPNTSPFPAIKQELSGKSLEELKAIADSMQ